MGSPSRRNIIAGAGAGLFAGIGVNAAPAPLWSNEYWTKKGDVPLNLFRKRAGSPRKGDAVLPVLFLVHGSSISSRPSFDLTVAPGHGEYSVMNTFARLGFDVWTMDHENYGRSGRTESNSNIASGVEDLKAAVEVVARETSLNSYHFFGESSGALRAGAFAIERPERVGRLVLAAFTYKGEGWSLTNDGSQIYMDDGSAQIRIWDPTTLQEKKRLTVRDGGRPIEKLNELEWVRGEIYANIWFSDRIARISPADGHVLGWIDLTGILPTSDREGANVLNGIAYDAEGDRLFVTGKYWPKMFEIKVVPKSASARKAAAATSKSASPAH